MKLSELYSEYIANWMSDGGLISRDKISLLGIRPLFDRYLTNQYLVGVWKVTHVPVHFDKNLTDLIRKEMYERHPNVKTVVHMYNVPVSIRVNSDSFQRHLKQASKQYYQYEDLFQSLTEAEKEIGVVERGVGGIKLKVDSDTLLSIKDTYDSYMYLHRSVSDGKTFSDTWYFVQAFFKNKAEMAKYDKSLTQMLYGLGIYTQRVRGNVSQYLDNFCPAAYNQGDVKKFPTMLMSQENVAAFMPTVTRGLIGKGGIMLGMDWETGLPAHMDFTGSGSAQVVMIEGKSGCGKTYLGSEIAIETTSFYAHGSVIDIKGGEWRKVLKYVPGIEIDMSGEGARFVNLMRLDDLECTKENCAEAYNSAINSVVGLFEVCTNLNPREGNEADLRAILSQAVEKVYSNNGVEKSNPITFKRTAEFKYEMVLGIISTLETSNSFTDEQQKICKIIKMRCAPYFMGEGRYSAAFKNEITVNDVLQQKLVIYNFNKNQGETLDIIDNVRVYMARCLDSRKHFIRKQKGLHQVVFYEELQRCGSMKTLIRNISDDVTGSRSNNLTVFLLLNSVATFDADDFSAIRSNITTYMIGNNNEADIRKLVTEYDCKDIEKEMKKIHANRGNKYSNCFAVSYDTGNDKDTFILKTVMPRDMEETFKTRDILQLG